MINECKVKEFENTVEKLLLEYGGGTPYFDKLDECIKHDVELLRMLSVISRNCNNSYNTRYISTGEIGLCLNNYGIQIDILVSGGLRKDCAKLNLAPFAKCIKGKEFVLIDDSYYKGRTSDKITQEIEKYGGEVVKIVVAYDGSKIENEKVISLYRYYDNHQQK